MRDLLDLDPGDKKSPKRRKKVPKKLNDIIKFFKIYFIKSNTVLMVVMCMRIHNSAKFREKYFFL